MDNVSLRRRSLLALSGLLPGVLLGVPKQLQAGIHTIKPFLHQLEMENMATLKPVRQLSATCKNEGNGITVLYMDGKTEPLFAMNRTGKTVWDACNGENTLKDIAAVLNEKYEVSREQACVDAFFALRDLQSKGAVRF